jgi:hypothetical protein
MKNTWRHYLRRFAATSVVAGACAWSSAMCYAVQLAYDDASDSVYNDGWQEGDDGDGTGGFGPWNFDGTYNTLDPGQQAMDDGLKTGTQTSMPFNDIGEAWVLYNPVGRPRGTSNGPVGTDIARVGRSFPELQIGQTLSVVVDNPSESFYFRGHTIRLNTGANANGCYNGDNCTTPAYDPGAVDAVIAMGTFAYTDYGKWYEQDALDPSDDLWDYQTNNGVKIEFTLHEPDVDGNNYTYKMTPLDNPGLAVTVSAMADTISGIDWIQFDFYNTDSDTYPGLACTPGPACVFSDEDAFSGSTPLTGNLRPTDYYIRSIEISTPDPPGLPGDFNQNGKVDAADYVIWRKNTGNAALPNDNGLTTQAARFDLWRGNFGNMTMPGGGSAGVGAVPEPGTFVYLVAGALGLGSLSLRGSRARRE